MVAVQTALGASSEIGGSAVASTPSGTLLRVTKGTGAIAVSGAASPAAWNAERDSSGIPYGGQVLLGLVADQPGAQAPGAQSGGPPPTQSAWFTPRQAGLARRPGGVCTRKRAQGAEYVLARRIPAATRGEAP
jgi:hypothetical protein